MTHSHSILTLILLLALSVTGCSSSPSGQTDESLSSSDPLDDGVDTSEFVNAASVNPQSEKLQPYDDGPSSIQTLRIKHHMIECEGFEVGHCLLIQQSGADEWSYFYDTIEGFDYRWGYDYEIVVEVEKQRTTGPDGPTQRYTLLDVVVESRADTNPSFDYITRDSSQRIEEISPNHFSLLGNKVFTCSDDACHSLRSAIAQKQAALLSLQHSNDPEAPLVLNAVLCAETATAFNASCI